MQCPGKLSPNRISCAVLSVSTSLRAATPVDACTKLCPQQKACMASFHHSCPSPDICNTALAPKMTILTTRSISSFVCGRRGVLVSCRHPSWRHAFGSSPELSA
eukprot:1289145-Pyramimonas_sp.AAC.1